MGGDTVEVADVDDPQGEAVYGDDLVVWGDTAYFSLVRFGEPGGTGRRLLRR